MNGTKDEVIKEDRADMPGQVCLGRESLGGFHLRNCTTRSAFTKVSLEAVGERE